MLYPSKKPRACAGFTLIEFIASLSIGATILALSAPMANLLRENTATSISYEFMSALNFARSEAIKRGNRVTICRTIDGTRCEGKPDVNGQKEWSTGWIIFSDLNGNGKFNSTQDEILRVRLALNKGYTLRSNSKVRVTYKPIGVSPGFMDSWTICTPGSQDTIKGVIIAYTGRIRLARDTNEDGIVDNGYGRQRKVRNLKCNT